MVNICNKTASRLLFACGRGLENILVPPRCVSCGSHRYGQLPVCRRCLRTLRASALCEPVPAPAWNGSVHALFRLTPVLQTLVHDGKYRHRRRPLHFLTDCLRWSRVLSTGLLRQALIVPVPLHAARLRERGYNQSALIARALGRMGLDCDMDERALIRTRPTVSQTRCDEFLRARNLAGAFRAVAHRVAGRKIVLVDDVCTTGGTLRFCREALMQAGAGQVEAFALAWVERRYPNSPAGNKAFAASKQAGGG